MISPIGDEAAIARKMQGVRERGRLDAHELKLGVNRMSDWREHVRAHPLPIVLAAASVSFLVAMSVTKPWNQNPSNALKRSAPKQSASDSDELLTKSTAMSAVGAIVGTVVTTALKQYLTSQVRNALRGK